MDNEVTKEVMKKLQNNEEKGELWQRFLRFLGLKAMISSRTKLKEHQRNLEPKYWPQVKDFLDAITEIIESHTIEDSNVQVINQRIVDYIADQINKKGAIEDVKERYLALDTLADRILVNNLSKIVGLKKSEGQRPEFSDAVNEFKKHLHERHQQELLQLNLKK